MKPARILLILVAAFFAAGVDGMGLRPLRAEFFTPKSRKPATSGASATPANHSNGEPTPVTAGHPDSGDLSAADLDRLMRSGDAAIIDARPPAQFKEGHIPTALNMPFEVFAGARPEQLDYFPPEQLFIIYCGGGDCDASEKVQIMLEAHGFSNIKVYRPGWPGWIEFGGEVEKGTPEG